MIKLLFLMVLSLTLCTFAFGQNPVETNPPGAKEVMLKFVELNNQKLLQTDEARLLFGGDALEWKFDWFEQNLSLPDKIISIEKNRSVTRVQIVEKNSRVVDLYFYLRFENGWTIRAMRSLAQTGWLESISAELKTKTSLTEDEKETLANGELFLSSDKMLTEWFQKNRPLLDKLVKLSLLETNWKPVKPPAPPKPRRLKNGTIVEVLHVAPDDLNNEPRTIEIIRNNTKKFPQSAAELKNLHLNALETKADGNVNITIGGITDNTVGFIYSPKEAPPKIDGWRFIWVEKIANGWYLFRTT